MEGNRIFVDNLQPGMKLLLPVYCNDIFLLPEGVELSEKHISKLRRFLIQSVVIRH